MMKRRETVVLPTHYVDREIDVIHPIEVNTRVRYRPQITEHVRHELAAADYQQLVDPQALARLREAYGAEIARSVAQGAPNLVLPPPLPAQLHPTLPPSIEDRGRLHAQPATPPQPLRLPPGAHQSGAPHLPSRHRGAPALPAPAEKPTPIADFFFGKRKDRA
jgi:hypothetical protein